MDMERRRIIADWVALPCGEINPSMTEAVATPSAKSVFANTHFRNLWLGGAVSALGDQFYLVALPWLVLQLTGANLGARTGPMCAGVSAAGLLVGGGAVSDRIA